MYVLGNCKFLSQVGTEYNLSLSANIFDNLLPVGFY